MDKFITKKIINKSSHSKKIDKNPILINTLIKQEALIKHETLNPSDLSPKYTNIKDNKLITNITEGSIILKKINKPEGDISVNKNINIFDITSIKSNTEIENPKELLTEINNLRTLISDDQKSKGSLRTISNR